MTLPAVLASGAHRCGEEAEFVVYQVARALDVAGSGRVPMLDVARELRVAYRGGKTGRLFERAGGCRWWELEGAVLRLRSQATILASFACEVIRSDLGRQFSMRQLDTRPRRNAAVLAAVLSGMGGPRSQEFIRRFAKVDRGTLRRWEKDEVIRREILRKLANWAEM